VRRLPLRSRGSGPSRRLAAPRPLRRCRAAWAKPRSHRWRSHSGRAIPSSGNAASICDRHVARCWRSGIWRACRRTWWNQGGLARRRHPL